MYDTLHDDDQFGEYVIRPVTQGCLLCGAAVPTDREDEYCNDTCRSVDLTGEIR